MNLFRKWDHIHDGGVIVAVDEAQGSITVSHSLRDRLRGAVVRWWRRHIVDEDPYDRSFR